MEFILVRHGESEYNVRKLCNDDPRKKVSLTKRGAKQAKQASHKLKNQPIDAIYASELPRTIQTAKIINEFHNLNICLDPRLNDRKTGFEGQKVRKFKAAIKNDKLRAKVRAGESFLEEKERILSFLNDIVKEDHKKVLIVGHTEPLSILRGLLVDLEDETILNSSFKNCEISFINNHIERQIYISN